MIALLALACLDAEAAGRARLSRDLVERLGSVRERAVRVIVSGDDEGIDRLAARHGARVAKRLDGGAVLELAERTLDALSEDPEVAHLSGDVPVRRLMSVTTAAIGADQVWDGGALAGIAGATGRGIGVAVIDSGIAVHPALRAAWWRAVDFTDSRGVEPDEYGHGTHVAGIIAASPDSGYTGRRPGRAPGQPEGAEGGRLGRHQRRDRGDRLGREEPRPLQPAGHQPIARAPGVRKLS